MKKIFLFMTTAFLGTVSYAPAQPSNDGYRMMAPGMMGWAYGMGWFWWFLMIIFWVVVIAGIVLLLRWISVSGKKKNGSNRASETAIDILNKRYARGEISKEEYEKIKKDISE